MKRKEILFCNIIVLDGKKEILVEKVVLLEDEIIYNNRKLFKSPLKIIKKEVIKSLGFENKNNGFVNAIKSEEKRNIITGSYD